MTHSAIQTPALVRRLAFAAGLIVATVYPTATRAALVVMHGDGQWTRIRVNLVGTRSGPRAREVIPQVGRLLEEVFPLAKDVSLIVTLPSGKRANLPIEG